MQKVSGFIQSIKIWPKNEANVHKHILIELATIPAFLAFRNAAVMTSVINSPGISQTTLSKSGLSTL